jgi:hypothetical protein
MIYAIAILDNVPHTKPQGMMGGLIEYIQVDKLVVAGIRNLDLETLKNQGEEVLITAVIAHDRLICELFNQNFLLPLRFGTVFKSQSLLEVYLESNHAQLSTKLNQLKGYSEYLLTLTLLETPSAPDLSSNLKGKDYLLAKRSQYLTEQARRSQQQSECQELIELIQPPNIPNIDGLEVSEQFTLNQSVPPQDKEFLRMYFLAKTQLNAIFAPWQAKYPHWQLQLSNPLPPYHFCD